MEKWLELAKKIKDLINPSTFPVAVKITKEEAQIPSRAKRPLRDLNVKMAPCQGAAMARRYGWTLAFGREDSGCAIAAHTYGWERITDDAGATRFFTLMNYAADKEAAAGVIAGFLRLEMGEDLFTVYSPLERVGVEPDVILIYVNPAQLMRLIHGATFHSGSPIESRFSGRAASCTEGVIGAFLDQKPKVVVPGNGDRVWAGCQDHEMIMAVPAALLAQVVQGVERTHQTGIRYPIPTYLRYSPEVAFAIPLSDIFRLDQVQEFAKGRESGK